jgi:hypothetical protein
MVCPVSACLKTYPNEDWAVQRGQVAQVVERSPEKAGVGGSTPSLATISSITYNRLIASRISSRGGIL